MSDQERKLSKSMPVPVGRDAFNEPDLPFPESQGETEQRAPEILLENLDHYKNAIMQFKYKVAELVKDQIITEQTATKIILENEYSFFQQFIKIKYE